MDSRYLMILLLIINLMSTLVHIVNGTNDNGDEMMDDINLNVDLTLKTPAEEIDDFNNWIKLYDQLFEEPQLAQRPSFDNWKIKLDTMMKIEQGVTFWLDALRLPYDDRNSFKLLRYFSYGSELKQIFKTVMFAQSTTIEMLNRLTDHNSMSCLLQDMESYLMVPTLFQDNSYTRRISEYLIRRQLDNCWQRLIHLFKLNAHLTSVESMLMITRVMKILSSREVSNKSTGYIDRIGNDEISDILAEVLSRMFYPLGPDILRFQRDKLKRSIKNTFDYEFRRLSSQMCYLNRKLLTLAYGYKHRFPGFTKSLKDDDGVRWITMLNLSCFIEKQDSVDISNRAVDKLLKSQNSLLQTIN